MFAKKINKRDNDFAFSSIAFMSVCLVCNVFAIAIILENLNIITINIKLASILVGISAIGINYFLLMRNNKSKEIIAYYDKEYESKKYSKWWVGFVIFYIIFSYAFCIYFAYLKRNQLL